MCYDLNIVLLLHVNQHHSSKEYWFLPIKITANYPHSRYRRLTLSQGQSVKEAPKLLCQGVGRVERAALSPLFVSFTL